MATRYAYDLDHSNEWRWYAIGEGGKLAAMSPVGYPHLQDCLHAVALLQAPDNLSVMPGIAAGRTAEPPELSLSRLQRHPQPHR